jgi:nucleotide-binding universal stress UspA family protein
MSDERSRLFNKILVASDGSAASMKAARTADAVASAFGADLTVVTVAYIPKMYKVDLSGDMESAYIEDWEHVLKDTLSVMGEDIQAESKLIRAEAPAEAILHEAEKGRYDLIVIGSTGMGNPGSRVMGSVATKVGAGASCSVMVIR